MKRKKSKKEKQSNGKSKENETEVKEYGVVLKKDETYRHRIYPQKGKVPDEDDDYKIV